jgi:predicted PurR-regulated permease PerM
MPRARSLAFTVASGALLAYLLWRVFAPFLAPIAWAAVLAILLSPAYRRLRFRVRRPNLAALVATFLTILLVVLPGVLVGAALVQQGMRLYATASQFVSTHRLASAADLFRIPFFQRSIGRISEIVPVSSADIQVWLQTGLKGAAGRAAEFASSLAIGFLGMVASFFIMIFTLFFFFRDGEDLWRRLASALPLERERTAELTARLGSVLHAVMLGTILTAILQGALGAIGFAVFGLPSPVVFGAIMAVLSLLPVGGTALVWIPAAAILAAQGAWGRGIGLFVWGLLIVGLADNWFKPMIISGHSEMNTLPVFFGVMGGLAAFGFLGLFVGPLVVSLGIAVLDTAAAEGGAAGKPAAPLAGSG